MRELETHDRDTFISGIALEEFLETEIKDKGKKLSYKNASISIDKGKEEITKRLSIRVSTYLGHFADQSAIESVNRLYFPLLYSTNGKDFNEAIQEAKKSVGTATLFIVTKRRIYDVLESLNIDICDI